MRILLFFHLLACSHALPDALRRLAWLEGDAQTNYQTDRRYAEERLRQFEGKEPSFEDLDRYLEYLAVLDATGNPRAIKKIKEFIIARPKDKRAAFLMGVHFLRLGKRDFAKYLFGQLENDDAFPWKSLVLNNLGMMALLSLNRDQAVSFFERSTKASPKIAAPFANLGALYLQSASYKDAIPLFLEARRIDPDFEDAFVGLAVAFEGQRKFEAAHEVYVEYIESHDRAMTALYNDSIILGNQLKQRERAAEQMLRYIQRGGRETARAHEMMRLWR